MKLFKKAKKGFTLVELVVVIAVIAILAAVSVGAYFGVTDSANKSRLEQEARQTYEGIRLISLADPENNQSLTIDGLSLDTSDDGVTEFTNDLVYATGQSYSVTLDEKPSTGIVGPTVVLLKNFYDTSVSSASGSKENYKSFNYYTNHVTGYAANVNLINGKIEIISDEFEITPPVADTAVTGVALSDTSFPNFVTGNSVTLTATVTPSTATNKAVRWESSDTSVITVNNGECTAVGAGDATVTVTTEEGGFTATCTFHVEDPYIAVTGISLDKQSETVYVDADPVTLTATVTPANATDKTVIWTSSNEAVATVSNGVVIFNAVGTVTITASCGIFSTGCNFDVRPHAGTISINSDDLNLHVGDEGSLTATVTPENAINKNYKWSSNNAAVVTIDENTGAYAAVGKGDAIITATSTDNNEVKDTINVNVKKHVGSFSINGSESVKLELNGNKTITLETSFDSETSYGTSDIIWTVENGDAVTVNAGVVTAVKLGTATVRATVDGKTDAVNFTVVNIASGVSIDGEETLRFNKDGETRTLSAVVTPTDAEGSVAWESSNTNVVSINASTGEYTLVGKGNATITATIGGHSDSINIIVEVPVSGITFKVGNEQKDNVSLTKGQDSSQFVPVIANADETSYELNGTWGVEDPTVATVEDGVITALKTGSTTVYYEIENRVDTNNNFRGSISVNVTNPATAITITNTELSVQEGQTLTLTTSVIPNDADAYTINWSSDNTDVATVSNGVVTGESQGTAKITAAISDTVKAECTITVTELVPYWTKVEANEENTLVDGDKIVLVTQFSGNTKVFNSLESSKLLQTGSIIPLNNDGSFNHSNLDSDAFIFELESKENGYYFKSSSGYLNHDKSSGNTNLNFVQSQNSSSYWNIKSIFDIGLATITSSRDTSRKLLVQNKERLGAYNPQDGDTNIYGNPIIFKLVGDIPEPVIPELESFGIKLSTNSLEMEIDDAATVLFNGTKSPSNASNPELKSLTLVEGEGIVSISGLTVTALAAGTATIKAIDINGVESDEIIITVKAPQSGGDDSGSEEVEGWNLVKDINNLEIGDEVIIAAKKATLQ